MVEEQQDGGVAKRELLPQSYNAQDPFREPSSLQEIELRSLELKKEPFTSPPATR